MFGGQAITRAVASAGLLATMIVGPVHAQGNVAQTIIALDAASKQAAPAGMTPADAKLYTTETAWIKSARTRINALGVKSGVLSPHPGAQPAATAQKMFATLQATLLKEGAKYDVMTGASKARHDIAMNAIRNMKA